MIALTDNAIEAVRRVLAGDAAKALRVVIETGGCQGYRYRLELDETPAGDDAVLAFGDVTLFIDPVSFPLLDGAEVDYVESVDGAGFVFDNPNAKAKCGCGKSFC